MMDTAFFTELQYWHWWIAGVGLIALEILAPGTFFLWLGVAAGITGLALFIVPTLTWEIQVLSFSVLAVVSIIVGRKVWQPGKMVSEQPGLNRRGEQNIGRVVKLVEPIANGRGKVRIGDTQWLVSGDDLPVGTQVRVTGIDSTVLQVERADAAEAEAEI
jgi:hypothetical protein